MIAKLQTPVEGVKKVAAGGAVFTCTGETCEAASPGPETASYGACRQVARKVGALVSFGTAAKPFTAERLARCNEVGWK